MLSKYASNVISAKVRAMYGKRINVDDYEALMSCTHISEIATYLKSNSCYSRELSDINELEVRRNQLENLIKKKLFHDLEKLCRYGISTGNSFTEYTIAKFEIEQLLHSLMHLSSGNPSKYIYDLPMFFNKRTKIDLMNLAAIKNYDDFLNVLKDTPYGKLLEPYRPNEGKLIDISAIERALYTYLYNKFFTALKKIKSKKIRSELSNIIKNYIDYNNFVRVVRLKRIKNNNFDNAILDFGTIKSKYYQDMYNAKDESELFEIMKLTSCGKKLNKIKFNYADELPNIILYDSCKKMIRFSLHPSVIMLSYIFLLQIEIENLITIIEGVHYKLPKSDIKKLLILKDYYREDVV